MDIEKIKTQMCDNYCKHFAEIRATFEDIDRGQEELDRICERCPLNELEEVEVVHGKWDNYSITSEYSGQTYYNFKCSVCGDNHGVMWDFCPNCGADMRGGTDDN